MLENGSQVYYIEGSEIYSGFVIDMVKTDGGFTFSIDSYGGCEGNYVISSGQIGLTVFMTLEEAVKYRGF